MIRRFLYTAAFVALIAHPAWAQVKLERKYQPGSYKAETTAKVEQKLTIAGMDVETASNTHSVSTTTIGKRDGAGMIPVQEKLESLKIDTSVMGMQYSFDSANQDATGSSQLEMLRPVHKAMLKRTTTMLINKDNRVESVKDDNDVLGSLPVEAQQIVQGQFDTEQIKKSANEELAQIPSSPVSVGDTWEHSHRANFGAGQVMTFKSNLKYEGTVEKDGKTLDKITSKTLSVDFMLENSPLQLTLKSSDLKIPESQSVILFDRKAGRVVETNSSMRITGDMTFVIGTMELPSKLDLKMSSSIVVK